MKNAIDGLVAHNSHILYAARACLHKARNQTRCTGPFTIDALCKTAIELLELEQDLPSVSLDREKVAGIIDLLENDRNDDQIREATIRITELIFATEEAVRS